MSFFGGGGFGQPQPQQQQPAAFGQQPANPGGFGQPAQPPQSIGGFGQPQQASGFGQAAGGGFGQAAGGGFGAPKSFGGGFGQTTQASTGFGQPQQPSTGFGQPAGGGGFGQPAAGGFGQPQQPSTGFGQPAAGGGGFGQPAAGGFGQPAASGGGFGQPAAGGFGATSTATGFGQTSVGGFGQPQQPSGGGGFGQPQQSSTGFGQPATGGFGQLQQSSTGFGQPAGGGFGAKPATTGFGQTSMGGFGQPQQTSGFGQPAAGGGGFGQAAGGGFGASKSFGGGFGQTTQASTGFGQPQQPSTGFGQPAAGGGGFGQPAAGGGGFGQPAAGGGGFGQSLQQQGGGWGQMGQQPGAAGGFGQSTMNSFGSQPAGAVTTAPAFTPPVYRPNDHSFLALPDYDAKPYGEVLLFANYDRPEKPKPVPPSNTISEGAQGPIGLSRPLIHSWLTRQEPMLDSRAAIKQQPAALTASAVSSAALRDILQPSVALGASRPGGSRGGEPKGAGDDVAEGHEGRYSSFVSRNPAAPTCGTDEYVTQPSLEELATMSTDSLRQVRDFYVGRRDGKCEIRFVVPVNLENVEITGALRLAPDGKVELTPGGALDVPAVVAVFGVEGVSVEDLREACREQGRCRFLSYNNSVWKYTLNEDFEPSATQESADQDVSLRARDDSVDRLSIHHEEVDEQTEDAIARQRGASRDTAERRRAPPSGSAQLIPAPTAMFAHKASRSAVLTPTPVKMVPFELPYEVPDLTRRPARPKVDVVIPSSGPTTFPEKPTYVVAKDQSEVYTKHVRSAGARGKGGGAAAGPWLLSRSFRAAWGRPCLSVAIPSFAELHDGLEESADVPEVRGAHVVVVNPFAWAKPAAKPLTATLVAVVRLFLEYSVLEPATHPAGIAALEEAIGKGHYSEVGVQLSRRVSATTLSEEKLANLLTSIREASSVVSQAHFSQVEARSLRQCHSVVTLLSALYALPEADQANPNALEEARYQQQLRHRNLTKWLTAELSDLLRCTSFDSKAEELVQIMLCHRLREAREVAKQLNSEDLARVVRVCGEGNQFGSYVEMARTGFQDGEAVRERVVSLLSGKVEPFISQNEYEDLNGPSPKANPVAATWKQLLGIFAFYGCTPDTSANDIVLSFLERLKAPSSRATRPLPPYAERVDNSLLATRRGADAVKRGNGFPDAALLVLEGFAEGTTPPAVALHPHASSYCGTDFLTPFVILCAMRALGFPREAEYVDAELRTLFGVTAQLEANDDTWFWGLVPLHMVEPDSARWHAVRGFCQRNALRASRILTSGESNKHFATLQHILTKLKVDKAELEPVKPVELKPAEAPVNRPSLKTLEDLQRALSRLALTVS